jgi:hypothetical protein
MVYRMIFHPKIGQKVKCHYRKDSPASCEGLRGEVVCVGKGPGPRNVLIRVDLWGDGKTFFYEVIPRGNLVAI